MNKILIILVSLGLLLFSGCASTTSVLLSLYGEDDEIVTSSLIHHKNHEGSVYLNSFNQILDADEIIYFMACPVEHNIHFIRLDLSANTAPIRVELFEDPIVNNTGTPINMVNTNRELNYNHSSAIYANPTITDDGTRLFVDAVSGSNKILNDFSLTGEILLAKNHCYIIKITNDNGNGNEIFGSLFMYEN